MFVSSVGVACVSHNIEIPSQISRETLFKYYYSATALACVCVACASGIGTRLGFCYFRLRHKMWRNVCKNVCRQIMRISFCDDDDNDATMKCKMKWNALNISLSSPSSLVFVQIVGGKYFHQVNGTTGMRVNKWFYRYLELLGETFKYLLQSPFSTINGSKFICVRRQSLMFIANNKFPLTVKDWILMSSLIIFFIYAPSKPIMAKNVKENNQVAFKIMSIKE